MNCSYCSVSTAGKHEAHCPNFVTGDEPIILSRVSCNCHKRISELEKEGSEKAH